MTEKRFTMIYFETDGNLIFDETKHNGEWYDSTECLQDNEIVEFLNELHETNEQLQHDATILIQANQDYRKENEQLKKDNEYFQELLDRYEIKTNDFDKFMNNREHTRLSINLETGELQRHIYATGNWFGDFDRVLVTNWLDEESYHRFIDRVIEVFNTEFKKELKE